jgi:hypothetical protein
MAVTKQLARQYTFEINDGTVSVPDWVEITGVNTWAHQPSKNDADTTTFEDAGVTTHLPASRGHAYTLGGLVKYDGDTGDRDPGQLAVMAWAQRIGPEGLQQFRITEPGAAGDTYVFLASASVQVGGGGNDDPSAWSVTVNVSGAVEASALPALPVAPTSPTGTTADDSTVVSWTGPASGSPFIEFEVVVVLASGGAEVKRVRSSEEPILVSGLTGGTGYKVRVRARNASGWGPESADSSTITPT